MAKRILLGKWGSGSDDYGLKVSKAGSEVINSDGTAVDMEDLIFDSDNAVGSLGIYKVYNITSVPAVTANGSGATGGGFGQNGTAGSTTQPFGETLGFVPFAVVQRTDVSNDFHIIGGASWTASIMNGNLGGASGFQDSQGFDDSGYYYITTTTGITIYNYESSTID